MPLDLTANTHPSFVLGAIANTNYARRNDVALTASSAQPDFSVDHLRDPVDSTRWASQNTALQTLTLDLGENPIFNPRVGAIGVGRLNATSHALSLFCASNTELVDLVSLPASITSSVLATGDIDDIAHGLDAATPSGITIAAGGNVEILFHDLPQGANPEIAEGGAHIALQFRATGGSSEPLLDVLRRPVRIDLLQGGNPVLELTRSLDLVGESRALQQIFTLGQDVTTVGGIPGALGVRLINPGPEDIHLEEAEIRFEQSGALWRSGWQRVGNQEHDPTAAAVAEHFGTLAVPTTRLPATTAAWLGATEIDNPTITSARFWKAKVLDGGNPEGFISAGSILIGPSYPSPSPDGNQIQGLRITDSPRIAIETTAEITERTLSGKEIHTILGNRRRASFNVLDLTEKALPVLFQHIFPSDAPMLVAIAPGNQLAPGALTMVARLSGERGLDLWADDTAYVTANLNVVEV